MGGRRNLRELVSTLPVRDVAVEAEVNDSILRTRASNIPGYVWPDVECQESEPAAVLLVTAPGAMGKTAAAESVARELRAPIIDLSKLRVGSDTLTGRITGVLGWKVAPEYIDELRHGRSALVLDSLDEAQLLSGREHFIAFLKNISEILGASPSPSKQIVIFGRKDSVETAFLALADFGIAAEMCEIDALSHSQSCELIDHTLDRRATNGVNYTVHRVHPEPFGRLRDQVFHDLAAALGASGDNLSELWKPAEGFLGYPPVLLVLAERLAVDNPAAVIGGGGLLTIQEGGTGVARGYLLREIVEGILAREATKVREQIAKSLSLRAEDCVALYSNEEQCLRVLSIISSIALDLIPPLSLEAAEKVVYEDQIASFALDHPFLSDRSFSNIVFADYVRAFVSTSPTADLFGVRRSDLLQVCRTAGPFFAHFVHSLSGRLISGGDDFAQRYGLRIAAPVAESMVDELMRSYAAGTPVPTIASFASRAQSGQAHLLLEEFTERQDSNGLFFEVQDSSGVLELYSPLARCVVISDDGLVLTAKGEEFEIGPNVALFVKELQINASRFTASGDTVQTASVLVISPEISHQADLKVAAFPDSALRVHLGESRYQWRPFEVDRTKIAGTIDPGLSHEVSFWIRRIIVSFRAGAGDNPSIFGEMFERLTIGSSPVADATFRALLELKIVLKRGDMYMLDLSVLSTFGVNYAAVRGSDFVTVLERLHEEVLVSSAIKQLISDE
jgi:hypothetical protein